MWCVQHNGRCRDCDNRCRGACNTSNVRCRACGSSCCDACNGCSTLQRLLPWLWEQLLRRACNSLAAAAAVTTQLPWRMQRPLPWLPWRMHTAPGDINRAQHMRAGLRGAYRCITRLFRGTLVRQDNCARCSAMNRTDCCCPAARLCISPPPAPAPGQLNYPSDVAGAAGCSPQAASAAEHALWHTV